MDQQTLRDEQQDKAMSWPTTHDFTCEGRVGAHPALMTPPSLGRRCDHIIGLIDELLAVQGSCANTAEARAERRCRPSPGAGPGRWGVRAGGDDVAS